MGWHWLLLRNIRLLNVSLTGIDWGSLLKFSWITRYQVFRFFSLDVWQVLWLVVTDLLLVLIQLFASKDCVDLEDRLAFKLRKTKIKRQDFIDSFFIFSWLHLLRLKFKIASDFFQLWCNASDILMKLGIIKWAPESFNDHFSNLSITNNLWAFNLLRVLLSNLFFYVLLTNHLFVLNNLLCEWFWQITSLSISVKHVSEAFFHLSLNHQSFLLDILHLLLNQINSFLQNSWI